MNDAMEHQPRDFPPLLFRLAKSLERKRIRGGTWLLRVLARSGRLDTPVKFPLSASVSVIVPIARNQYDRVDLDEYETRFLTRMRHELEGFSGSVTLIDVGADIGLFTMKLAATVPRIDRIVALEPNVDGFLWLQRNLGQLKVPTQTINSAVADFVGAGRLFAPERPPHPNDQANHTQLYLVRDSAGPISVTSLDALEPSIHGETVVLKVDVEGGELAVLRGCKRTMRQARSVIVGIEAHPEVFSRTGTDPIECLRFLSRIRQFRFLVAETGTKITTALPFFEQVPADRVYNMIAVSTE